MAPDRIAAAASEVKSAAHELVAEVKKERRSRRIQGVALVVIIALLVAGYFVDRHRKDVELTQRLCAAWENRRQDHATLTGYLATFVGTNERGQQFVVGLRKAYADSDADYATERGLTREKCS